MAELYLKLWKSRKKIGLKYNPLIIAEIGINHCGDINIAKEMVDSAKRAGVEVVNTNHIVEDEMSPAAKNVKPGNSDLSIYEIMDSCSLNKEEEYELKIILKKGMIFISTPFSRAAVERLVEFEVQLLRLKR